MLFCIPRLNFDDQSTPDVVKTHAEVVCLEVPQTGRDERAHKQRAERTASSSVRKQKSVFSSAFLAAVTTGTVGKRFVLRLNTKCTLLTKQSSPKYWSNVLYL